MILKDLKEALERGVQVRILTGNYLGITQPSALYLIKKELGNINYITGEISNISGDIVSASDTDLVAKYNFLVNIEEYATISSNLRGFPGQTLFIIDKFEGANGLQQVNTYMYFWDESVKTNSGDIQIKGQWQNANLNLVSQLSIKNLDFSVDDLKKLKGLLANNDLFAN